MFELLVTIPPPDPTAVLYGLQAGTHATIAATPEHALHHRRITLCHWLSAGIYLAIAALHALHG